MTAFSTASTTTFRARPARSVRRACQTLSPSAWSTDLSQWTLLSRRPPPRDRGGLRVHVALRLVRSTGKGLIPSADAGPLKADFERSPAPPKRRRRLHENRSGARQDRTGFQLAPDEPRPAAARALARRHRKPAHGRDRKLLAAADRTRPAKRRRCRRRRPRRRPPRRPKRPDDDHASEESGGTASPGEAEEAGKGKGTAAATERETRKRKQLRSRAAAAGGRKAMSEHLRSRERYRLEGRLGFGGMSTVHLAFDRGWSGASRSSCSPSTSPRTRPSSRAFGARLRRPRGWCTEHRAGLRLRLRRAQRASTSS